MFIQIGFGSNALYILSGKCRAKDFPADPARVAQNAGAAINHLGDQKYMGEMVALTDFIRRTQIGGLSMEQRTLSGGARPCAKREARIESKLKNARMFSRRCPLIAPELTL